MRQFVSLLLGVSLVLCLTSTSAASDERGDKKNLTDRVVFESPNTGDDAPDRSDGISDIDVLTKGGEGNWIYPPLRAIIRDGEKKEGKGGEYLETRVVESLFFIWLTLLPH